MQWVLLSYADAVLMNSLILTRNVFSGKFFFLDENVAAADFIDDEDNKNLKETTPVVDFSLIPSSEV